MITSSIQVVNAEAADKRRNFTKNLQIRRFFVKFRNDSKLFSVSAELTDNRLTHGLRHIITAPAIECHVILVIDEAGLKQSIADAHLLKHPCIQKAGRPPTAGPQTGRPRPFRAPMMLESMEVALFLELTYMKVPFIFPSPL